MRVGVQMDPNMPVMVLPDIRWDISKHIKISQNLGVSIKCTFLKKYNRVKKRFFEGALVLLFNHKVHCNNIEMVIPDFLQYHNRYC